MGDAENQQERLVRIGWIVGFVDGEGCFSIGFIRQSGGGSRRGYRTGWQVAHEFAVTQGARSVQCLHELGEFFGVGQVVRNTRPDRDRSDHRNHEPAQAQARPDQNPQRLYARGPGHRVMR